MAEKTAMRTPEQTPEKESFPNPEQGLAAFLQINHWIENHGQLSEDNCRRYFMSLGRRGV